MTAYACGILRPGITCWNTPSYALDDWRSARNASRRNGGQLKPSSRRIKPSNEQIKPSRGRKQKL